MAFIPLEQTGKNPIPPILRLGFRPFFLSAGIFSAMLLGLWLYSFLTSFNPSTNYSPTLWHAHEMIFGYTAAVIAGFLLTAVKNWTGIPTLRGYWLAELVMLWLAARLFPIMDFHPLLSAFTSVAFFPFLAFALAIPLIRADSRANLLFIPVLLLFAIGDIIFQLAILQLIDVSPMLGIQLSLHTIVILIVLMGARVIPFFIARSTATDIPALPLTIERLTYFSLILWSLSSLVLGSLATWTAIFAGLSAIFQAYRLKAWYVKKLWSIPMLWILYLGYCWLFIGLALQALGGIVPVIPSISTHALTTGAIGMITLGMMSRVSLGHTGRGINHTRILLLAFLLIALTPVIRVFLPLLFPGFYIQAILISGITWVSAFALFSLMYTPILVKARIDGRDG